MKDMRGKRRGKRHTEKGGGGNVRVCIMIFQKIQVLVITEKKHQGESRGEREGGHRGGERADYWLTCLCD